VVVQLNQTNQRQEKMMASDHEKIKTNPAAENEASPEKKSTSGAEASKADGGESAAASPPGYSRGEATVSFQVGSFAACKHFPMVSSLISAETKFSECLGTPFHHFLPRCWRGKCAVSCLAPAASLTDTN
jgi:hypothetical protein